MYKQKFLNNNEDDDIHVIYKEKIKEILGYACAEFFVCIESKKITEKEIEEWVNTFVEKRFNNN